MASARHNLNGGCRPQGRADARLRPSLESALPTVSRRARVGSPPLAVFLSFLWPGLGQWYLGRQRAAVAYALPILLGAAVLAWQLLDGLEVLAARLLSPTFALTVLILIVLLGLWRILAMLDSMSPEGGLPRFRRESLRGSVVPATAILAAVVLVSHGVLAYGAYSFYDAGSRIFVGGSDGNGMPPLQPGAGGTADPTYLEATPYATPETADSRITVLFSGIDSGAGRQHALTDTLLVASYDPETGDVAMISFPRDISDFPLYDGRTYHGKINSLMVQAALNPRAYPDGPLTTVTKELGYLLGVPIHYFAAINLDGFRQMIDIVGGVTVVNPRAINDPGYDWLDGTHGFFLPAGEVHLDGRTGLAYVRSRQGIGDSDYTRAARQQQVLVALRKKVTNPGVLTRLPRLLDAAARTIKTNFPSDQLDSVLALARDVDESKIQRFVLGPPYSFHPPTSETGGTWILRLRMSRLKDLSVELFGSSSRYYEIAPEPTPTSSPSP